MWVLEKGLCALPTGCRVNIWKTELYFHIAMKSKRGFQCQLFILTLCQPQKIHPIPLTHIWQKENEEMAERPVHAHRADTGPGNFMEPQIHRRTAISFFYLLWRSLKNIKCEWKLSRSWSQDCRVQALICLDWEPREIKEKQDSLETAIPVPLKPRHQMVRGAR